MRKTYLNPPHISLFTSGILSPCPPPSTGKPSLPKLFIICKHCCASIRPIRPATRLAAVEYLAGVLRVEGFDPIVLESAPQRGNVIARLKGDGSLPPLLLYNHLDVVPAEPQHRTHPPFGGDVADGFVWGRGALDMKNVTAMQLMTLLTLKRNNVPLHRDVIFAARPTKKSTATWAQSG